MQTVTAAVSWKGLSLRFVTSAPRTHRGKQLDLTARCSGKSHRNARAQPGLMQVPPRRWKTLRLRLDFKLKAVGLLKLRSASLSLLPETPSDFDAHVMWRRQHALHLGFTVCPTYRPFNTVGENKGESETNYMEYMSQVITLIRQKPNHDTLIHTCLLFSVYTTMAATVVIACKCPPVWVATCSHVGVPSVCAQWADRALYYVH